MALHSISFCSGVGGLDLGVELATEFLFGVPAKPILYVEREAYAASVLVSRMADGQLADAPIWSDLTRMQRGAVSAFLAQADLWFGGIPCQPWSLAGNREGTQDERDLWPHLRELVGKHLPSAIFLENVSGFAVWDGLGRVARDLRDLGYRVAATILAAKDVGASHERKRLFILAYRDGKGRGEQFGVEPGVWSRRDTDGCDAELGESAGLGREGFSPEPPKRGSGWRVSESGRRSAELADAENDHGRRGKRTAKAGIGPAGIGRRRPSSGDRELEHAPEPGHEGGGQELPLDRYPELANPRHGTGGCVEVARTGQPHSEIGPCDHDSVGGPGFGLFAPGPNDPAWANILTLSPELAPAIPNAEFLAGRQADSQPDIRGLADGLARAMELRRHRLRATGNGVVPLQATVAFVALWIALTGGE